MIRPTTDEYDELPACAKESMNDSTSCSSSEDLLPLPTKKKILQGSVIAMVDSHNHKNIDLEGPTLSRSIAIASNKTKERDLPFGLFDSDSHFASLGKRYVQALAFDCYAKRCSRIDATHDDLENLINHHFKVKKDRLKEISERFDAYTTNTSRK